MNFTGGVRVVKGNPVIVGVLPEKPMADTLQERVAEVIKEASLRKLREIQNGGSLIAEDINNQAAAEVIKLLEAEDKTLTLMASEAGIPLYKAMKIADYGKKQYKERVLAELPEEEEGSRTNSHLDSKADGWNACRAEMRRRLEDK